MASLTLGGDAESALTHLTLLGAAAIVQAGLPGADVTLQWRNDNGWRGVLDVHDVTEATIGAVVADHAIARVKPDSWVNADIDHEGRPTGVFSPRIKVATSDDSWSELQDRRWRGIDALAGDDDGALDRRFIQALGEPAYWRPSPTGTRADDGASRLEMKTRNRGEEFVQNRLRLLAGAVASRSSDQIVAGLTGAALRDEAGKNKADSRSGTGLTGPGPVDNAVAWCALWGISQFSLIQRVTSRSSTCGFITGKRTAAGLAIPMAMWPVTPARMRSILLGTQVTIAAQRDVLGPPGREQVESQLAADHLRARGVGMIMRFPWWSSSGNAPEFRLLSGSPVRLGDPGPAPY